MQKTILILSGPTHEYIDPVRFIGNASSGKMGKALAEKASGRGYEVEFITGPVAEAILPERSNNIHIHKVTSAEEMLAAARELSEKADVIIFAAAVADYAPAEKLAEKMAKSSGLTLHLQPSPDIAKTLCAGKAPNQIAIGFALQTAEGEANARRKLETKNLDGIVLNTPATLGAENGTFSFLSRHAGNFDEWGCIDKDSCAKNIFDAIDRLTA